MEPRSGGFRGSSSRGPGGRTGGARGAGGKTYGGAGRRGPAGAHGSQGGRDGGFEGKPRFMRKKVCRLCAERLPSLDFKDTDRILKFLTEKGKILPQRISGNCAKHQRMVAKAVKCARHASLIAFEIGV